MGFWKNLLVDGGIGAAAGAADISPVAANNVYSRFRRKGTQEPNNLHQEPNNIYSPQSHGIAPMSAPMLRNGGFVGPDGTAVVGDGTDDPRAEELIHVAPDGSGVSVQPLVPHASVDGNPPLPNVLSSVFGDLADSGGIAPKVSGDFSGAANSGSPLDLYKQATAPQVNDSLGLQSAAQNVAANSGPVPYDPRSQRADLSAMPSAIERPKVNTDDSQGILPSVEDDPNLVRRQQRLMTDGATPSHWYERLGMGALRGLAKGGIGGAIGGATVGLIGKGLYDHNKTDRELAETNDLIKSQDAHQKAVYDTQKAGADYQHQLIQNQLGLDEIGYKRLIQDPQWLIAQQTKTITPQQAQYLSTLVGKPVTQASWQTLVEKTDPATGKSLIRPEFDPRYSVNPTISPDATVPPVGVNVGGIPLTLKQPEVGQMVVSENQANANRTQQSQIHNATASDEAARFNAQEQTRVAQAQFNNRIEAMKQAGANVGNAGEVKGFADKGSSLLNQMQGLEATINSTDSKITPQDKERAQAEYNRLQGEFSDNLSKFNAALGKTQGGLQVLNQLQQLDSQIPAAKTYTPTNVAPVQTNTVKPAAPAGKVLTAAAVKAAAKQHGVSYSTALKQAQAQGYTIQQ